MLNFKHINNITGLRAFAGCFNVTEISFKDNTTITTIPSYGNGRDSVTYATFHSMPKLKTVIFDNSVVTTIKGCNFSSCSVLETVSFKNCDALTTFEGGCFRDTTLLKTIDMSECPNLTTFCNDSTGLSFRNSGLETLILDNTKVASFQKGLNSSGIVYHFTNCPFKKLSFKNCTELTTIDFSGYTRNTLVDLDVTGCTALTTIGSYVFSDAANLEEVTGWDDVKDTLTTIGNSAFKNCTKLNIDLLNIPNLVIIEDSAFQNDPLITELNFTDYTALTTIGANAFDSCTGLTTANFTNCSSLIKFGWEAFLNDTNLTTINLTGCTAFNEFNARCCKNCTSLSTITDWENLKTHITTFNNGCFNGCSSLNIDLSNMPELQYIYNTFSGTNAPLQGAFTGCTSLTTNISNCPKLEKIGAYSFKNCTSLGDIDLHDTTTLTTIGSYAFNNAKITNVNLNGCSNLANIEVGTFNSSKVVNFTMNDCTSVTNLTGGAASSSSFGTCSLLKTFSAKNCTSLVKIGELAFANCSSLTSLDCSGCSALTTLGQRVFQKMGNNVTIDFTGCKLNNFSTACFQMCKILSLTTQLDEDSTITLGNYIFASVGSNFTWNVIGTNTFPQTKPTEISTTGTFALHFSASAKNLYTAQALLLEDALAGATALNAWCCSNGEVSTTTGGTAGDVTCDVNAFYNNKLSSISFDL